MNEPSLTTNATISHYRIVTKLGAGGIDEVYLAKDRMGRNVALKLLAPRLTTDTQHVARFLQEAHTVLALNHPHIITISEVGEAGGHSFIASELIEGEALRRDLVRSELDLAATLDISIQVATALAAAHEKGIVHRDQAGKRHDSQRRLRQGFRVWRGEIDQEFASLVSTESPTRRRMETAEGVVVGTASCMSPEQARGMKARRICE